MMLFSKLKKSLYGQAEAAHLWYEKLRNGFLERGFVMSKVDPCLFMSKTVICVVYVDDCLFWERSQSEFDNVMKSLKEDGPSYNWEHSEGESMSEFLGIDIKTLDNGVFQFFQNGLIRKVWKPQGWRIVMGYQHPPILRHLLEQT